MICPHLPLAAEIGNSYFVFRRCSAVTYHVPKTSEVLITMYFSQWRTNFPSRFRTFYLFVLPMRWMYLFAGLCL